MMINYFQCSDHMTINLINNTSKIILKTRTKTIHSTINDAKKNSFTMINAGEHTKNIDQKKSSKWKGSLHLLHSFFDWIKLLTSEKYSGLTV